MELKKNRREEFKQVMTEWFKQIHHNDLASIERDVRYTWGEWGIQFIAMERFGETLTMGGEWESEGVAIEVNINPKVPDNEFRVLYRWS
jgi:hypothetical protein